MTETETLEKDAFYGEEDDSAFYVRNNQDIRGVDNRLINQFQERVKYYCMELCENPPVSRVLEICDKFDDFVTNDMIKEIQTEYAYYYDKGVIEWIHHSPVQCGYIDYLKHFLTKLVRFQVENPNTMVLHRIQNFHRQWFNKPRYWDDYELDRLDTIISKISSSS